MNNNNQEKEIKNKEISGWSKQADFRLKNRKWLRYSSEVARRTLAALEDNKQLKTQKDLAQLIQVSPQQISKILKGQQNLTLETIAKLSTALGVELIEFPVYKYSQPVITCSVGSPSTTSLKLYNNNITKSATSPEIIYELLNNAKQSEPIKMNNVFVMDENRLKAG